MLIGPDTNSWKVGFNYPLAKQQGSTVTYVKQGGNNISGNRPYFSDSYAKFVDDARNAGYSHVGHYWVTGGNNIVESANFFADHIRGRTPSDFYVLDNEALDAGRRWTDAESALFFRTLIARGINSNLFLYGSRDNDLGRHAWPETLGLGVKVIAANFNNKPLVNFVPSTIPAQYVKGHQYTSSANVGGLSNIDMNAFLDDAFTGGTATATNPKGRKMYLEWDTGGTGWLVLEPCWVPLGSMQIYNLFKRVINSNQAAGAPDTFLRAEVDMMNAVQVGGYRNVLGGPVTMPTLDTTKLADAVVTALNAKGIKTAIDASDPNLSSALDAAFLRATTAYANAAAAATGEKINFDPDKLAHAVAESLQSTGIVVTPDTDAVQAAVSEAIARATAAIAKATTTTPSA
jgi:hypothetical protein